MSEPCRWSVEPDDPPYSRVPRDGPSFHAWCLLPSGEKWETWNGSTEAEAWDFALRKNGQAWPVGTRVYMRVHGGRHGLGTVVGHEPPSLLCAPHVCHQIWSDRHGGISYLYEKAMEGFKRLTFAEAEEIEART